MLLRRILIGSALGLSVTVAPPAQADPAPVHYTCNYYSGLFDIGPNQPWGFAWECSGPAGNHQRVSFDNSPPNTMRWCMSTSADNAPDGMKRVTGYGCWGGLI
jgi:hypothetical protein